MTEEEIKAEEARKDAEAAKKKDIDAVTAAWTRSPHKDEADKKADEAEEQQQPPAEGILPLDGHKGGVNETVRRAELNRKLQAEATGELTPEQEAAAKADADKKLADEEAAKAKKPVQFNLRPNKPAEGKPPEEKPAEEKPAEDAPTDAPAGELSEEDKAFVAALPLEMRDSVEFWKSAEGVDPDKYKGKLDSVLGYYKRYHAEAERLKEDDDEFDPETSPELRRWVTAQQDRPRVGFMEQQQVIEKIVDKKAAERQSQIDQRNQAERHAEAERPKIRQAVEGFNQDLADAIPAEVMQTYQDATADGGDADAAILAISDEHGPEVAQAIKSTVNHSTDVAEAFISLTRGVEPYDQHNKAHIEASNTVISLGKEMMENPELEKFRTDDQGRTFLPREKFYAPTMTPELQAKHFTFTEQRVLEMLAHRSKADLKVRLAAADEVIKKREERWMKKHGVDPAKKNAAPASSDADEPPPSRYNPGESGKDKTDPLVNAMIRGVARTDD